MMSVDYQSSQRLNINGLSITSLMLDEKQKELIKERVKTFTSKSELNNAETSFEHVGVGEIELDFNEAEHEVREVKVRSILDA